MDIDDIAIRAALFAAAGWFAGLVYHNWLASTGTTVPLWAHVVLIVVGPFATALLIGFGLAIVGGAANKVIFGQADAGHGFFILAGIVSMPGAFFAAEYALTLLAG